jgi:drug/metabolite transporter (DMT)-like permease
VTGLKASPELGRHDRPLAGIVYKLLAVVLFSLMYAGVRWSGPYFPTGEIVFFRSVCGLPVIVATALVNGGPKVLLTSRIDSHALRSLAGTMSMFSYFSAYALLPLADATAISFASPLFVVMLAAFTLGEQVHVYRWSAVVVGFIGVLVIVAPELGIAHGASGATLGAFLALAGAGLTAVAMIALRRMSAHEHAITVAFYFMLTTAAISLLTAFFGWTWPDRNQAIVLVLTGAAGGLAQLLLSFSYRYSEASLLAPFDYTAILFAVGLGWAIFGELPSSTVWLGAMIVTAAGLMIVWRERKLGIKNRTAILEYDEGLEDGL